MKSKSKYVVHKNLIRLGCLHGIQESPDICESKREAVLCFREAFRHLLGRMPSDRQVERVRSGKTLASRWRGYVWNFAISKVVK